MRYILLVLWGIAAFYFGICIFIPEIRPYIEYSRFYTGKDKKAGLSSCIGVAIMLWVPMLIYAAIITGILSNDFIFGVILAFILGGVMLMIGTWIDLIT